MNPAGYPEWLRVSLSLFSHYWPWILIWTSIISGFVKGAFLQWSKHRHKMIKAQARADAYKEQLRRPYQDVIKEVQAGAGPCKHRRNVIPVHNTTTGKREAWLCQQCDTQLPADYAIEAEDL